MCPPVAADAVDKRTNDLVVDFTSAIRTPVSAATGRVENNVISSAADSPTKLVQIITSFRFVNVPSPLHGKSFAYVSANVV